MTLSILAIAAGLAVLVWSADRFVVGSSALARHLGMPPLLIGMLIVGFGTSAPEMVVSALAASSGNAGIALGNAFGSNIANIGLILGLTALITPIAVHSRVLRRELPILAVVTALTAWLIVDGGLTRVDALVLLGAFAVLTLWTILQGLRRRSDALAVEMAEELAGQQMRPARAVLLVAAGLLLLVGSSQLLVWGAVGIAGALGVSDLLIGLTVVAVGTSLPELASSLAAARRGEHDLALGNILGSNLFNTLAVVGIAAAIRPFPVESAVLSRDLPVMCALTLSLFAFGYGFRGPGRINRVEGLLLLAAFAAYMSWLVLGTPA